MGARSGVIGAWRCDRPQPLPYVGMSMPERRAHPRAFELTYTSLVIDVRTVPIEASKCRFIA